MEADIRMSDIETPPAEDFRGPKRYRIQCRCLRCGKPYSYVTAKISDYDRPCPRKRCKQAAVDEQVERAARNMAAIIVSQRPPGHIGDSVIVKAVDATAQIVMEDHKMTDLQDNLRTGDMAAPKLPPAQQKLADGFFGGQAVAERNGVSSRQMQALGRRAMAGAFRNMSVNPQIAVPGKKGESPLTLVRTEQLQDTRRR